MTGTINRDLFRAVVTMRRAWFAVADGAHFDDLPALLEQRRLVSHPLYLEASGESGVKAGPHLLGLADERQLLSLLEVIGDKPAICFWSWPNDLSALRRHLRSLNLVRIPNQHRQRAEDPEHETVLFRHWDPNVLAATLPLLSQDQKSRFGAAATVAFSASDSGSASMVQFSSRSGQARGQLRFKPKQVAHLADWKMTAAMQRIVSYLHQVAPDETRVLTDAQLLNAVKDYVDEARNVGLSSERDVGRWAYLQVKTDGMLLESSYARAVFLDADSTVSAPARLNVLFSELTNEVASR